MLESYAPCVAVLEDLDWVFAGDKPREGVVLGYECLLNIMDGISASDGVCVFVTSNKPEQLDEALMRKMPDGSYVTRPGRIDKVVELGKKYRVTGTPTIFFTDGSRIPGAIDAKALENKLATVK